jgi:hypothetical protein
LDRFSSPHQPDETGLPHLSLTFTRTVQIRFQQAVYGSFPFWHRGYGVLAQSAGCRPQWIAELRTICQRYGEPPATMPQFDSLFALPMKCGPWVIAGVHSLGHDDRDRPGALAFHALFVSRWAYRSAGADPFIFAAALRKDWSPTDQDQSLPEGSLTIRRSFLSWPEVAANGPTASIVTALAERRRVIVKSIDPIDGLARNIWRALPYHVRRRAAAATWAFDNANHFDLVALPKLEGVPLRASDLIVAHAPALGNETLPLAR